MTPFLRMTKLIRFFLLPALLCVLACPEQGGAVPAFPEPAQCPELDGLPNPFVHCDGRPVPNPEAWPERRAELREMLLHYAYGHPPAMPVTVQALDVQERMRRGGEEREVTFSLETQGGAAPFRMQCGIVFPANGGPKFPVILAIDPVWQPHVEETARQVTGRGYAFAGFVYHDVDDDNADRGNGVYPAFPGNDWATLAAWAWAASRLTDYLTTRDDVDAARIAVTGHSRCGKAALLAGALDERFTLTAPHASGAGGAGSFRIQPKGVETLELITAPDRFHYWFHPNLRGFSGMENRLPFDQHFLKALVAPRALLSMEAFGDKWANPSGSWQTHLAAREVFRFLDAEGRIMAWYRPGGHDLTPEDWTALLDAADHVFKGRALPNALRKNPFPAEKASFPWRAPEQAKGAP